MCADVCAPYTSDLFFSNPASGRKGLPRSLPGSVRALGVDHSCMGLGLPFPQPADNSDAACFSLSLTFPGPGKNWSCSNAADEKNSKVHSFSISPSNPIVLGTYGPMCSRVRLRLGAVDLAQEHASIPPFSPTLATLTSARWLAPIRQREARYSPSSVDSSAVSPLCFRELGHANFFFVCTI